MALYIILQMKEDLYISQRKTHNVAGIINIHRRAFTVTIFNSSLEIHHDFE